MHMSDENRDNRNAMDLVHRFEQMISSNDSYYFDIDQFEEIIDFYCENNQFPLALRAIEYGYNLFPENMTLMLREAQILTGMGHLTRALKLLKKLEKIEASDQIEHVYKIVRHLAANQRDVVLHGDHAKPGSLSVSYKRSWFIEFQI